MSDPLATVDAEGLRAGWGLKWGGLEAPVLPAWIAESDAEVAPVILEALDRMLHAGELTYPPDEAPGQLRGGVRGTRGGSPWLADRA